jgi:hypothetical protein
MLGPGRPIASRATDQLGGSHDRSFEKSKVIARLFGYGIRRNNGVRIGIDTETFAVVLVFSES